MAGRVQGRQKTVKLPSKAPNPEKEDVMIFRLRFDVENKKLTSPLATTPKRIPIAKLKTILDTVRFAPITHIESFIPGIVAIK